MFSEIRKDGWVLMFEDGNPVLTGTEYVYENKIPYYIAGGTPPANPKSPGIIWVYRHGAPLTETYAVYPWAFNMSWVVDNFGATHEVAVIDKCAPTNIVWLAHKT